jgi:hypothetical protein
VGAVPSLFGPGKSASADAKICLELLGVTEGKFGLFLGFLSQKLKS